MTKQRHFRFNRYPLRHDFVPHSMNVWSALDYALFCCGDVPAKPPRGICLCGADVLHLHYKTIDRQQRRVASTGIRLFKGRAP